MSLEDRNKSDLRKELQDLRKKHDALLLANTTLSQQHDDASALLRKNRDEIRDVQRFGAIGIWRENNTGTQVSWSEELYSIYGFSPGSLPLALSQLSKIFCPGYWDLFKAALCGTSKPADSYELELEIMHQEGSKRWISVRGKTTFTRNGDVIEQMGVVKDITSNKILEIELKKAREEIRENEKRFKDLAGSSGDWFWEVDEKGKYTYSSSKANDFLGLRNEEIIGKTPFDFMPAEEAKRVAAIFSKISATKSPILNLENWNTNNKKKELRCLLTNGVPLLDEKGHLKGYRGIDKDITDIKLTELALKEKNEEYLAINETLKETNLELINAKEKAEESEFRLELATSSGQLGIWDWDVKNNIMLWNERMFELYGSKKDQFPNNDDAWVNGLHPEDKQRAIEESTRALNGGKDFDTTFRVLHPNGNILYLKASGSVIRDSEGTAVRMIGINSDITERKEAEESLQKQNNLFDTLLRNLEMGVYMIEAPSGKPLLANAASFKILGRDMMPPSSTETISQWFNLLKTDTLEPYPNEELPIVVAMKGITKRVDDMVVVRPDGTKIDVEVFGSPITDQKGNIWASVVTFHDITDRKRAEKAYVQNQRLSTIGEMAASVAHDFNNSLQAMSGNIDVVKLKTQLPESIIKYLNNIESLITDVASRVRSLQRFGDTSHERKDLQAVDLNAIIIESITQTRPLWKDSPEKNGMTIDIKTQLGEIMKITGNEGELKTSFLNILKNSIEAMPKGGTISITSGIKHKKVVLTISDTGIGMNEETKTKLFHPFYTTKGFDAGRGLGMSSVYTIFREMGGDISVKFSEPGKGTVIELVFPITMQEEKIKDQEIKKRTPNEKIKLKVLWVEDDDTIRENASTIVQELLGHTCDTANSGKTALKLLKKNSYDLVITDIGMPDMSGWELAGVINSMFHGNLPIAIVSGWQVEESKKKEYGVKYVLGKPFSMKAVETLFANLKSGK